MARRRRRKHVNRGSRVITLFVILVLSFWFYGGMWGKISQDRPGLGFVKKARLPVQAAAQTQAVSILTTEAQWAQEHQIGLEQLEGAKRAAGIDRGGGKKVSMFVILGILNKERWGAAPSQINPEASGPWGHHIAITRYHLHSILDDKLEELYRQKVCARLGLNPDKVHSYADLEEASLRKLSNRLGLDPNEVYGSKWGAIGWCQALPHMWIEKMGNQGNPWNYSDAAEFTARYLVDAGYFTRGTQAAIQSYNPYAPASEYLNPVMEEIRKLEQSYHLRSSGKFTHNPLEVMIETGVPFGAYSIWQPQGHSGRDFKASTGTPLYAVADGEVVSTDWLYRKNGSPKTGRGYSVVISHGINANGEKVWSTCAHCFKIVVKKGDRVRSGDLIAYSGSTGAGDCPHLHFEVRIGGEFTGIPEDPWKGGRWEDPYHYLPRIEFQNVKVAGVPCGGDCIWSSQCAERVGLQGTVCVRKGSCRSCEG